MTTDQTAPVTFVLIVRMPVDGVADFRAYEDAVLPLLPEFNGCLQRRLRNADGTMEVHVIRFASDADFHNYRNDPRRAAQAWLLEQSGAKAELLTMVDVTRGHQTGGSYHGDTTLHRRRLRRRALPSPASHPMLLTKRKGNTDEQDRHRDFGGTQSGGDRRACHAGGKPRL